MKIPIIFKSVCSTFRASRPLQIVTGAQNVFVGAVVPVAMDGAKLPGGKTIKTGALRGVKSEGMLCSGEELNVDPEQFRESAVYGIWILDANTPIGIDIRTVIGCDEVLVEFKTLANRPDCMSMVGIARETAVTFDVPLTLPKISVKESRRRRQRICVRERRGFRTLPALLRACREGRPSCAVARMDAARADRRRRSPDQQRRRHRELRHARAGAADARV